MVLDLYNSPLCETLNKAGMSFLIPESPTSYDDDEGPGHMDPEAAWIPDEWEVEQYYENEYFEDEDLFAEEEEDDTFEYKINNLDELMLYFNCDTYDPEDFINLSAWELFGLTLPQFKRVQSTYLNLLNCHKFHDLVTKNKYNLSVEQNIKWSTVCAVTDCDYRVSDECLDYCIHLACLYDESKAIDLIRLYCDYLRFLPNALIMNERRADKTNTEFTGPVFNYKLCPKPNHIKDLHDKAFRDFQVIETERALKEKAALDKGILEASNGFDYKRFLIKDDKFMLVAPKCYDDFEKEGKELDHCIASYADQFKNLETYIYFLRETENPDKPYYSIEVIPKNYGSHGTTYSLNQCYTYHDSINKSDACRDFIINWCKKFKIKINCTL